MTYSVICLFIMTKLGNEIY